MEFCIRVVLGNKRVVLSYNRVHLPVFQLYITF
jgi:hypothetical protein